LTAQSNHTVVQVDMLNLFATSFKPVIRGLALMLFLQIQLKSMLSRYYNNTEFKGFIFIKRIKIGPDIIQPLPITGRNSTHVQNRVTHWLLY